MLLEVEFDIRSLLFDGSQDLEDLYWRLISHTRSQGGVILAHLWSTVVPTKYLNSMRRHRPYDNVD